MCDLSMFVNYLILYVNIFTDVSIRKYDAVFDNSSFLDDTSTSDHMGTFALNAGIAGAKEVTGLDISEFAIEQEELGLVRF